MVHPGVIGGQVSVGLHASLKVALSSSGAAQLSSSARFERAVAGSRSAYEQYEATAPGIARSSAIIANAAACQRNSSGLRQINEI